MDGLDCVLDRSEVFTPLRPHFLPVLQSAHCLPTFLLKILRMLLLLSLFFRAIAGCSLFISLLRDRGQFFALQQPLHP